MAEKVDEFVCKSFLTTKVKKVTSIGARLTQFSLSVYEMSVISYVSNLTR